MPADAPAPAPDARGVDDALRVLRRCRTLNVYESGAARPEEWFNAPTWALDVVLDRALAARADGAGDALSLIAGERQRQRDAEGWTPAHDDEHRNGELAAAAASYAWPHSTARGTDIPALWPWGEQWWKPTPDDRVRELVKAGALIVAEIERLHRAADTATPPSPRAGAVEHEPGCMWHAGEACDRACRYRDEDERAGAEAAKRRAVDYRAELERVVVECGLGHDTFSEAAQIVRAKLAALEEALTVERQRAERAEAVLREVMPVVELMGAAYIARYHHGEDSDEYVEALNAAVSLSIGLVQYAREDTAARPPAAPRAGGDDAA